MTSFGWILHLVTCNCEAADKQINLFFVCLLNTKAERIPLSLDYPFMREGVKEDLGMG